MDKTAVAIRHVQFEDLGSFEPALEAFGFRTEYFDVGLKDLRTLDPEQPDLLIVLGGPIGVYQKDIYPFVAEEIGVLEARIAANLPIFGICLGAQLIARALGAEVGPCGTKEIGFSELVLTAEAKSGPMRHLLGIPVLHWHGDVSAVPKGALKLAETPVCSNQAFSIGANIMGVQFHPEVSDRRKFERWLIGHACELAEAGVDVRQLRRHADMYGAELSQAGRKFFSEWLSDLAL